MALKSGRVGVREDQVDAYGRIIYEIPEELEVEELSTKKLSAFANDGSRYIDGNPTNKTTSLYGYVKVGSTETPTNMEVNGELGVDELDVHEVANFNSASVETNIEVEGMVKTDSIVSNTEVGGEVVEGFSFNSTDNHWHLSNTKVDDTITIDGELELGSTGDLGENLQSEINTIAKSSGTATQGQVLTADGEGGSSWANGGGETIHLYLHRIVFSIFVASNTTAPYALRVVTPDDVAYTSSDWLNKVKTYHGNFIENIFVCSNTQIGYGGMNLLSEEYTGYYGLMGSNSQTKSPTSIQFANDSVKQII